MTRKDYVNIAAAILAARETVDRHEVAAVNTVSRAVAAVMARDNPRFDRERFLKACGVQS